MKKIWIVILLSVHFTINAQENALYFDGIDDDVTVSGGSALISGLTEMSLSFWVYPENTAPVFPDFDGFCGFRNDVDADFYVVQIAANSVEARFRNSLGTSFDIIDTTLQLNTWQQYVLTYNGITLSLYRNSILVGSIAANGSIAQANQTLYIGNLLYSFNNYYLNGKIDEVCLWNLDLPQNVLQCLYQSYMDTASMTTEYVSSIDTASSALILYYRFNQGIANGNNSSITTLIPAKGNLSGTLNNFMLNGPGSNWSNGIKNGYPLMATICPGDNYVFGTQTLTQPGIYYENFPAANSCDSTVRLELSSLIYDSIVITSTSLVCLDTISSCQWISCLDSSLILGSGQNYTPPIGAYGFYAAILNNNGCIDTTDCIEWLQIGIKEPSNADIVFYPNPSNEKINVFSLSPNSIINLFDRNGTLVKSYHAEGDFTIDISDLSSGNYFIKIDDRAAISILKN